MPKALENKLKAEYKKKGKSGKELDRAVYGTLNKLGFMKGSKVTKKGQKADAKYRRDH